MNLDGETRDGYFVSSDMKCLWNAQLELLKEFQRVCKKNNIEYFACGGTLLGAVRHKGYIPWDDDIDLMMRRPEYEKFVKVSDQLNETVFFQTTETDQIVRAHAQLRMNNTTCLLLGDYAKNYHRGVFIDIFILDKAPDDKKERDELYSKITLAFSKMREPMCKLGRKRPKLAMVYDNTVYPMLKFLYNVKLKLGGGKTKLYQEFEKVCASYENMTEKYKYQNVSFEVTGALKNVLFEPQWLEERMEVPFEDMSISIPQEYDLVLKEQYGEYMKYVVADSNHGKIYSDLGHDYTSYDHLSNVDFMNLFEGEN